MKKGFTLIELLVAVLIIGILSSIALPQYRKAVDKAKLQKLVIQGRSLLEAQQLFVIANGSMTNDLDSLDITVPADTWACSAAANFCYSSYISGVYMEVSQYYGTNHLILECVAQQSNTYAQELCQSLGATEDHRHGGGIYYEIHRK